MESSQEITSKAKSNLAFALSILPKGKRQDLTVFYAYCRSIDDLADDEGIPEAQRREALNAWKQGLLEGFKEPTSLQREVTLLCERRELPLHLLTAIIEGCEMDLDKLRYQTWDDLDDYIWKVSCAVGLVCIRLFGCTSPESKNYAEALGRALQLTNILRDVGEDLVERNRIYLPLDDLHQFGYREDDLISRTQDRRFLKLMEFQATRADNFYEEANLCITPTDRYALRPARIMAEIYKKLLGKMRKDQFQVFNQRYRVGKLNKVLIGFRYLLS